MSEEEKLQALVADVRMLEAYLTEVASRQSAAARAIVETRAALETLESLSKIDSSQVLVPIGSGVFVESNTPRPDNLVVVLGAGAAVQKTREQTVIYLEERVKQLEKAVLAMESQRTDIAKRLNASRQVLANMIQQQRA